jgi:GT2 family glycosyltransferase
MSATDFATSPHNLEPSVSVVVGSFNRHSFLKDTIASVRAELADEDHEIVVVDGGSTDGTLRWLTRQKDVITVLQHNRGSWRGEEIRSKSWGYFMNLGFKVAGGKYICMLSDDCLVVPGAIRQGLELFERHEHESDRVGAIAFYFRDWPKETEYRVGRTFGDRMFVNHGLFLKEALEAVGYVREDGYRFYHADGDLCLRLSLAGYACIDSPHSFIEHFPHANTSVRRSNMAIQRADWDRYTAEWGGLGEPHRAWTKLEFSDEHHTAAEHWTWKWRIRRARGRVLGWLRMA